MQSITIKPILGLKTAVPPNDASLFVPLSENVFATHCVDCRNVDFNRVQNACSKAAGKTQWSNTAAATTTECVGIFELYDTSGNRVYFIFMADGSSKGRVFKYDSSRDPVRIHDGSSTEYSSDVSKPYSIIKFGNYMVFTDNGDHTPYKVDHNDTNLSKLILGGGATEYKFKYLESFQRRIIGASSDQTNGNLEIRWTDALPTWATLEFAAANQLWIPNDDPITGIKRMGQNACYVYSDESIHRLDYYVNYSFPFGFTNVVNTQGAANHHSIVDAGGRHYLFNKNYGFCEFRGTPQFPYGGKPISYNIENWIRDINASSYSYIVGKFIPNTSKIVWTVPIDDTVPDSLLFFDVITGQWERKDFAMRNLGIVTTSTSMTWTMLINDYGFTTWTSLGNLRWADLINEKPDLVYSNTDGHLYLDATEGDAGSAFDGYRTEPIMDFFRPNDKDLLREIWYDLSEVGDYSIYTQYRGGDTVGECKAAAWTALDEVSCNSPSEAICRMENNTTAHRFHQIKWGTDGASEPFVVSTIEFNYEPQGRY